MYANTINQSFKVIFMRPLVSESFVDIAGPSFWQGIFCFRLYGAGLGRGWRFFMAAHQ
jgi:hypothetical protein